MARARDPNRDKAFEIYKEHNGDIKLKDIAEQLGKSDSQIRKWKNQDEWDEKLKGNVTNKTNSNVTKQKKRKPQAEKRKERTTEPDELPIDENSDLTDKQWLFCRYYTKYWNATKAYQKVYECDYMQAMSNGSRLLRNDKIRREIAAIKRDIADGIMIESRAVLQKWIDIAFADISDYVKWGTEKRWIEDVLVGHDENGKKVYEDKEIDVNVIHLKDTDNIDTSIVTEIKQGKDGISVKLADKMKALDFLTKYMDLLDEKELQQLKVEKERITISKLSGNNSDTQESEIAKMLRKMAGDDE